MKKDVRDKGGKCTIAFTRRQVLKAGLIGAAGLMLPMKFTASKAIAQIPGGSLPPGSIPKFVSPLLIPPSMPRAGILWDSKIKKLVHYYEIAMRQFAQQILPAGLPATTVWGYGPARALNPKAILFNAPSLTIEADYNQPVRIKWINDLKDASGNYLPHLLPVDPTLHWANPPGGNAGRDMRPTFTETPGPYTGPVPIVTHVHGAVGVGDESDGYAEAWFLPNANNIPDGYAKEGTWYDFFKNKAKNAFGVNWGPGFATFQYPNKQRAATVWYHDHCLGMTRLNVYAGPAGFYIVRGGPGGDAAVRDSRNGRRAILPGPAPNEIDNLLSLLHTSRSREFHEIPIAIQDRSFNEDGSLFYPDSREFFDGYTGPFIPNTDFSPIWNPEFFGNVMMVNGNTWPFLEVEQRRYRFRFLNGCQSRFLILDFAQIPGVTVYQIGNEGGFLATPVNITVGHGNRLLMGLAERADLIVDFTNVPEGEYVLGNLGPDEPYGGGVPGDDFDPAHPDSTGQIMQFRVVPRTGLDLTTPPQSLQLPAIAPLPEPIRTRPLALIEEMADDMPVAALLGTVTDGVWAKQLWMDPVTENPGVGETETWEFYNTTGDAHPMHVHEVVFEVVNRQDITIDEDSQQVAVVAGTETPPEPWESGFKDTVIAYPGQVTRIRVKFDVPGQFVWHCHIVEHEDNEMMRPYRIGPKQPGQPGQQGQPDM
jgi:FtsP/CotA-like multicopper oxidase with cupredoxin domain